MTWETQQHGSTSALDGVLWVNFQVLSVRCNNSKQMETLSLYSLHLGEDVTWLVWFTWLFLCARWTGIVSDWCDSSLYLYIVNCLVWDWTSIKSVSWYGIEHPSNQCLGLGLNIHQISVLVWDWTSIKSVLCFFIVFCWVNDFIYLKITLCQIRCMDKWWQTLGIFLDEKIYRNPKVYMWSVWVYSMGQFFCFVLLCFIFDNGKKLLHLLFVRSSARNSCDHSLWNFHANLF